MAVRAKREVTLPESVTTEEEAVNYLTERKYNRFTLYEIVKIGTYAPSESPVVKVD